MQLCCGGLKVNGAVYAKLYKLKNITTNVLFQVDVVEKTCSCIQWQLRGVPCIHVVCLLKEIRVNWPDYCKDINDMRPPVDIKIPGIPYKKRKIGHDEYYTEKKVRSSTRCKHTGHNKRTCGGAHVGSNPKGKRQRTIVDGGSHTTSYPDPAELSTSRSLSRRGRGGRGRRGGRGAASSSSTSVSASPSTTSGRGSRGGRGGR